MKKIYALVCLLTISIVTQVYSAPVLVSEGNASLMDYKTFTVVSSKMPNTPAFLRELNVLQNLSYHLMREGYTYVDNMDDADMVVTAVLKDDIRQRYIPPRTYSITTYTADTSTDFTGMASGMSFGTGSFINFNATADSTTAGTAHTTTRTSGGYYVPIYGIKVIVNIYDSKSQSLIWYGVGYTRAKSIDLLPYTDNIIYHLVKEKIMTPAYIDNSRKKHKFSKKKLFTKEFLKPVGGKEYFSPTMNGGSIAGVDYIVTAELVSQKLNIVFDVTNNSDKAIEFDPSMFKVKVDDKACYIMSKKEVMDAVFKASNMNIKKAQYNTASWGIIGALFEPFGDLFGTSVKSRAESRDKAVRYYNEEYLDKGMIQPGGYTAGVFYVVMPFYMTGGEDVVIQLDVEGKTQEVRFKYDKDWMSEKDYKRWMKKLKR